MVGHRPLDHKATSSKSSRAGAEQEEDNDYSVAGSGSGSDNNCNTDQKSNPKSVNLIHSNRPRSSTDPTYTSRPSKSLHHRGGVRHKPSNSNASPTHKHKKLSPSPPPPQNRSRLNSREIPRTYSGLFGIGGNNELTHQTQTPSSDLLPFELQRNFNTEWLHSYPTHSYTHHSDLHGEKYNTAAITKSSSSSRRLGLPGLRNNIMSSSLFWIYIFFIALVEFALVVLPLPIINHYPELSLTITNILHGIITIIFLHWLKGSPNFYDYGELNALTLWEQLSCSPGEDANVVAMTQTTKQVLYIIPTVLCYFSCRFVNFDLVISLVNLSVWSVCIVAKMEGMHGVRLFGLNRTIGIDDDVRKRKEG